MAAEHPETPALDAWYETHPWRDRADHTRVSLWFPHEAPMVNLEVIELGWDKPPILHDPANPTAHVKLGTTIDIGGYLSEMEAYFAAVVDALRGARWQADRIAAYMAAEAKDGES